MSSDCEPTVQIAVESPPLRAALSRAFAAPAATQPGAYPATGDLVMTIGSVTHDLGGVPYPRAEACLTAVWDDRFRHVSLSVPSADLCETAKNAIPRLARADAEARLVETVATKAARLREGYRRITAGLGTCTLVASSPVTQLTLTLGDRHIGPFSGSRIELACLPTDNLMARYVVDGQRQAPFEISAAMCRVPVTLEITRGAPVDAGSPSLDAGQAAPPSPAEPAAGGARIPLTWFAVIASTIVLGSTLLVLLRRRFPRGALASGHPAPDPGDPGGAAGHRDPRRSILFLAANPLGTDRLALDEEARAIQNKLDSSRDRDRLDLITRWAARPLDLLDVLRRLGPTIVHFSGHGGSLDALPEATHRDVRARPSTPDAAPRHGLVFQGPDGRVELVSATALERTFGAVGASVKLVVLNACYSEDLADALVAYVDCVVGMTGSVPDDAAIAFAVGLYGALGERASVVAAYEQGRAALSLAGHDDVQPNLKVRDGVDPGKLVLAGP